MGQFKTVNIIKRWIHIYFVFLVITAKLINCEKSPNISSQLSLFTSKSLAKSSAKYILKMCSGETTNKLDSIKNYIRIPTFSGIKKSYSLKEYEIDRNNPREICPNGDKPHPNPITILAKADYDKEFETSNFSTRYLRSKSFLLDNGYLLVGDQEKHLAEYYSTDEFCINTIQDEDTSVNIDFKICPFSKTRPILRKCCPLGMILVNNSCMARKDSEKWDPGYMDVETWKMLKIDKVDPVYTFPKLPCDSRNREMWKEDNCTVKFHPVTDNTIVFIGAYRSWEFLSSSTDWCIESMEYYENGEEKQRKVLFYCVGNQTESEEINGKNQARISLLYMVNMYIGAFFHFLTTLVYLITWTKQNIHGKTLCSCTASLFFMQTFLGTAHLLGRIRSQRKTTICILNSIGGQYFMIAAFTWLVIVNYDLWRKLRPIRIKDGRDMKRLLIYSLIGWLFPLLVSAISISLDFSFPCRVSGVPIPEFGEYYCFVAPWAQGLYVYYLLGILIVISYVFGVLTLLRLYNFKKDKNQKKVERSKRSNKSGNDQQNVFLFLKLSIVMGLTWIFEVISWAATKENENHVGWIILDLYNALSAILIFAIFVCKKATLNSLEQSIPCFKGITTGMSKLTFKFPIRKTYSIESTGSTNVTGNFHKKSIESQHSHVFRYIKEEEDGSLNTRNNVSTNKTFVQK